MAEQEQTVTREDARASARSQSRSYTLAPGCEGWVEYNVGASSAGDFALTLARGEIHFTVRPKGSKVQGVSLDAIFEAIDAGLISITPDMVNLPGLADAGLIDVPDEGAASDDSPAGEEGEQS